MLLYFRDAEHGGYQRVGNLVLHDVGASVPLRIDDHLRVGGVGDGVQGDMPHRVDACGDCRSNEQENDESVVRAKIDDFVNHA